MRPCYSGCDHETDIEPTHPSTLEVRNLFEASILTENMISNEHEDDCPFPQSNGKKTCTCPEVTYYYLGRRAEPWLGLPKLTLTPWFPPLCELEDYCKEQIVNLRSRARSRDEGQIWWHTH